MIKTSDNYLLVVSLPSEHFWGHPVGGADHGEMLLLPGLAGVGTNRKESEDRITD